jgi:phosphopantothenoylcysteine synthetase/decarboxylase
VFQAKYTSATKNSESKSSGATAPNDAKGKKKTLATVVYAPSHNVCSDPSSTKRKHIDSGPKNTTKKQIPVKRQKETHDSEDDEMGEEDGSDGDDEGNHDHDHDNDDEEEEVEEVDPVAQYEAMRESIQKERCMSSISFFHQVTHFG